MTLRQLLPEPKSIFPENPEQRREMLHTLYQPPQQSMIRANMVIDAAGSVIDADGISAALSSSVDRMLLRIIRAHADVILVGAETVRAERYPMPKTAGLAIISRTGLLDGHRLNEGGPGPLLVFVPVSARRALRQSLGDRAAEIIDLPHTAPLPVSWILHTLRSRGLTMIVSEAGPNITRSLLREHAIDELCLSESTAISPRTLPAPFRPATLPAPHILLHDESDGTRFSVRTLRPAGSLQSS